MNKYIVLFSLAIYLFIYNPCNAQISVVDSQTASQLVQKLAGAGVTFSNITLTCPDTACGTFHTVSSNLGLGDGILLTCGKADNAVGPASNFAGTSLGTAGDAALTALINATTHDACKLEFDFVPIGDTVKFRYVFGSEEYPGYACTQFNDVFGFFISGPGYSSPKNIALIPNTTIPVAINSTSGVVGTSGGQLSVCQSMGTGSPFTQYYVNNSSGTTVTYNGFTTVLTALAVVVPCSTYHLKLAVADAIDGAFDSGVFLEAGSFSSNVLTISTGANLQAPVPYCVRGCKNGQFAFKRQKVTSLPLTVRYQIAGTAINGTDYTTIPDSVVIPANDSVITRSIVPLTTASGTKTVKLYIYNPYACSSSNPTILDSSEITIFDSIYARITIPDTGVCPGGSMQIVTTGDTILKYRWAPATGLNDTTLKSPTATPSVNTTYILTATLTNSTCTPVHDDVNISIYAPPHVTVEPANQGICVGSGGSFSLTATGQGLTYQWQSASGSVFSNITNNSTYGGATTNTLTISNATLVMNGLKYRCVVSGTCTPKDTSRVDTLTIYTLPSVTGSPSNRTLCENENTTFIVSATGSNLTYDWQVNKGTGFSSLSNNTTYSGVNTSVLSLTGAQYSMNGYVYRCVVGGACTPSATSANATLTVYKSPEVTADPVNTSVCPDSPASFTVSALATYINYQWQVNTGSGFTSIINNSTYSGVMTSTLAIAAAPAAMNGYKYRCVITGICDPPDTSAAATLSINTLPDVLSPPADSTICLGNNASFSIAAVGTSINYQWQVSSGGGFSNVINNAIYSGANSNTLIITGAPIAMDGYKYRCYITGICAPADTSADATLTINTLPAVVNAPGDSIVCEGDPASFSVGATGTGLTYQWQVNTGSGFASISNSSVYSGATASTLLLASTAAGMDNYQYRCIVSGVCSPAATSAIAVLTVNTRPAVNVQPHDSTVCDGGNAAFDVGATGTGLTYQWQLNSGSGFVNISNNSVYGGATTSTLAISAVTVSMSNYLYRCVVAGTCTPVATSAAATLTVNSLPAITMQAHDSTICEGDNASFSIAGTGTGLTYQWQVDNGAGYVNVTDNTVYSGATSGSLIITAGTASMDNYLYRCIVSGVCMPSVTSTPVRLTVFTRPSITLQPHDSTVCDGHNASFALTATGTAIAYQWQVNTGSGFANVANGSVYGGATTNALTISATTLAMSGYQYRCIISGTCTPVVTSSVVALTVNVLPQIQSQPADSTICENDDATFSVGAIGTGVSYQWQVNAGSGFVNIINDAVYSGATTNTLHVTAGSAPMNNYLYRCIVSGVCDPKDTSAVAQLTVHTRPAIQQEAHDSTVCDGNAASFAISATGTGITYQWQVNTGSGFADVANNSVYSGTTTNNLHVSASTVAMNGYQYRCVVSGVCPPAAISVPVTLTVYTLPDIQQQPGDSTICEGDNASFAIMAIGTSLTYQWQVNTGNGFVNLADNSVYNGAVSNTLSITAGSFGMDSNLYRCLIQGACTPPDTSMTAMLTVHTLPLIIAQPHDSTICAGNNAVFETDATGTGIVYQWQADTGTGFLNIVDDATYSGATTKSLYVTAGTANMNDYTYRCIVTGTCPPQATSAIAKLTVHILPDILSQPLDTFVCNGNDAAFDITATGTSISYQWQVNDGSGFVNVNNGSMYSGATASHLDITAAPSTMDSFLYRCIVSGVCTPPDTSIVAILRVGTPPAITSTPTATPICEGGDAIFSVGATGTNLHYQWQVNTGSGYIDILNGGVYSGANTNALMLTGVTSAMSGYLYQCVISGDCPPSITSGSLTLMLTVFTLPSVTSQAASSKICEGQNTNFTVSGAGTGITYHWQADTGTGYFNISDNAIYNGTSTPSLDITGALRSMSGYHYRCDIKGVCLPDAITQSVTLTVDTIPGILVQPKDTTVCEETPAAFLLTAEGTDRTYQWQLNDGTGFINLANAGYYSGVHTGLLQISVAKQQMHGYQYRCIINGLCDPPDTSVVVTLYTDTIPVITQQPVDSTICEGDNASFGIAAIGTNIGYQWQVNDGTGFVTLGNTNIFSGATTNTLTVTAAPSGMNNYYFRCIVVGTCMPPDTSLPAKINVRVRPHILSQPLNSTICDGSNTSFAVSAQGTAPTYQWQVNDGTGFANLTNNATYTGAATSSLSVLAATTLNNYQYRCIVSGACTPPDTSSFATLHVNVLPDVTLQPSDSTICEGGNAAFAIAAVGTGTGYQWQVNSGTGYVNVTNTAPYSGAATNTLSITAGAASMNNYYYRCIVTGTCTPPDTSLQAKLTVNTLPNITLQPKDSAMCEGLDASFMLTATGTAITYQWQVDDGSGYTDIANNTTYSGAMSDMLHVSAAPFSMNGYLYRCIVSGTCMPPDTSVAVHLTIYTSPVITTQPVNTIVCRYDTTTLSLVATGTALTYQWQTDTGTGFFDVPNNAIYAGATTDIIHINGATLTMNGDKFRCIVSGTCTPPDTSVIAALSVYTAPSVITQPRDTSICPGENASFKVYAVGSILAYQWQVDSGSGYKNLNSNATYSGTATVNLQITNASAAMNNFRFRCIVSGYCIPADTTVEVNLEMYAKPQAIITPEGPTTFCHGDSIVLNGLPATGVTYQWIFNNINIPGATNASFKAADSGVYKLEVFNVHCHSTSDSQVLTVYPVPSANMEIPGHDVICKDSTVLLLLQDAGKTDSYQWLKDDKDIPGANQPYYYAYEKGVYGILVTNTYGCSTRSVYKYIDDDEDIAPPYVDADNIYLCTQLFEGYQWYKDKQFIAGATDNCYLARENGVYTVKTTNIKGCVRISNEYTIDKIVVIWPNPTPGIINILSDILHTIRVTDMDGKVILTATDTRQIDISGVADGVYMLKLFDKYDKLITSERVVKSSR